MVMDRTMAEEAAVAAADIWQAVKAVPVGGQVYLTLESIRSTMHPDLRFSARLQKTAAASLRPVTIKQILTANQPHTDAEFTIDDTEPTQVSRSHLVSE
jgi:hypothetical protein